MTPLDAILFDLDGVLMTGDRPLPGAIGVLRQLLDAQFPFLILTNKTMEPRWRIAESFTRAGLNLPAELMQTPPAAAAEWLHARRDAKIALFVTPETHTEFADLDTLPPDATEGADYVVVGDMLEMWTYGELNRALRLLLNGAQLVALGMGRYWSAADGMRLDTGALASALAYASGQDPVVIGKPAEAFFQIAIDRIALPAERIGMVGDDVISDVSAAQDAGLEGILVQTGKYRESDLSMGVQPDWILADVTQVATLLALELP